MLIHLVPRMFACPVTESLCELYDFESPELGLKLSGDQDLIGRRPFPNKKYLVANRRVGRKAMNGFLIETKAPIRNFTTITRWNVIDRESVVSHRVTYRILDDEMDAITEDMTYWYAMSKALGGYAARWPEGRKSTPAQHQPSMELISRERSRRIVDSCDLDGLVMERAEEFVMHTVERERIVNRGNRDTDRIPDPATAFQAAV